MYRLPDPAAFATEEQAQAAIDRMTQAEGYEEAVRLMVARYNVTKAVYLRGDQRADLVAVIDDLLGAGHD